MGRSVVAISTFAAFVFAVPAYACIAGGSQIEINNALQGPDAEAVLCPNAVFNLTGPVNSTARGQKVYTEGRPAGSSRAVLRVTNIAEPRAFIGHFSNIQLDHIIIDGNRRNLGYPKYWVPELIEMGGAVTGQVVDHIKTLDPIGWSSLHLYESDDPNNPCTSATITHNDIGPAGSGYLGEWQRRPDGGGPWADGISPACTRSYVGYNTITNATDGGIVVFGAPGSTIDHNTVQTVSGTINDGATMAGAINLVDWPPYRGDYTGTLVEFNTVDAEAGFIRVGIGLGPAVAGVVAQRSRGGLVENNTIKGPAMGYGIVNAGMDEAVVKLNSFQGSYSGDIGRCPPGTAPPQAYVVDRPSINSYFQPGYIVGRVDDVMNCAMPAKSLK